MAHYFSYWIFGTFVLLMEEPMTVRGAENIYKYACIGDFIQLFRNITIDSTDMVVSLSIKASTNRVIAMWTLENATVSVGYSRKVFIDKYGDIWIRNVSSSDEAQYNLKVGAGIRFDKYTVELGVLAAPTLNCKPKIQRMADVLVATLESKECGNPPAYVDWLNYLGNHSEGKDSVMLPQENSAGTYYACIGGPAMMCARTSKFSDYCTAFQIDGKHGDQESKPFNPVPKIEETMRTYDLVMLIGITGVFLLQLVTLMLFFLRKSNTSLFCAIKQTRTVGKSDYCVVSTETNLSDAHLTPSSIGVSKR